MAEVAEIWDSIHTWLKSNAPQVLSTLRPAATEEQLKNLQEKLGLNDLPEDFKDLYRIHDGSTAEYFFGTSESSNSFHPIEEIIRDWSMLKEIVDEQGVEEPESQDENAKIQRLWWQPRWIPFGADGCGNYLSLDLAPTDAGTLGQVIVWSKDGDDYGYVASSVTEMLKKFVFELETGKFYETLEDGEIRLLHKDYDD